MCRNGAAQQIVVQASAFHQATRPWLSRFPGWLALRTIAPRTSQAWLLVTLALGAALGWVQVMRGAHFVSHWLWTGWICAAFAIALYHLSPCWRKKPGASALAMGELALPG